MISRRHFGALMGATLIASCGRSRLIDGKPVTMLVVYKGRRQLLVMSGREVLRVYPIQLGFEPEGHKQFEGDGKTPEGTYTINRKNPNSQYHLSLGISYPDRADWEYATAQGKSPGGEIFIHGTPGRFRNRDDWTAGCIAVSDRVMDVLFYAVPTGTRVHIAP